MCVTFQVAAKCLELGATQAEYIVADMADETAYQSVVEKSVKIMGRRFSSFNLPILHFLWI